MQTPVPACAIWVGCRFWAIRAVLLLALAVPEVSLATDFTDEESPPPVPPPEDLIPAQPKRPKPPRPPSADWAEWNNVSGFRGHSECRRINEKRVDNSTSVEGGYQEDISNGTFEFTRDSGGSFVLVSGQIAASHFAISAADRWDYHGKGGSYATMAGPSEEFGVTLDLKRGTWYFYAHGHLLQPYDYYWWLAARSWIGSSWKPDNRGPYSEKKKESAHFSTHGILPTGQPTALNGTWSVHTGTMRTGKSDLEGRVMLFPEYKDVEVVVEIEGTMPGGKTVPYAEWLPRGTPAGAAGSRLKVKAHLQMKDGSRFTAKVDNFSFQLNNTSREPGVCLNYPRISPPAGGTPAAPDLKFAPGGETDAERQQIDVLPFDDGAAHPYAETRIDCFDFGGWSDLTVTAELADGRIITGHLKGDLSAIVMPLPKRSGGSLIADAWKSAHSTTASDADDSEKLPNAGQEPGDGFTLYEEYRGFMENGRHLEGDPQKIDFFVRNYVGGDARPGIEL
ncbi:MAG: hypothetical protein ABIZ04_06345, partial [Opitutus sp.]